MANVKTIRITCTVANTAYNAATGTTSAPTTARDVTYVGQEVVFQNQTLAAIASFGDSSVVTTGQILVDQGTTSDPIGGNTPSSIQLADWWVSSDTAGGIVGILLRKLV